MIDLRNYGKARGKRAPLMLNIRLQRRGPKPTREEIVSVLEDILATGEVPHGWRLAFIDWRRPKSAVAGWRRGKLQAFNDFAAVIHTALRSARLSVVRQGKGAAASRDDNDDDRDDDFDDEEE